MVVTEMPLIFGLGMLLSDSCHAHLAAVHQFAAFADELNFTEANIL